MRSLLEVLLDGHHQLGLRLSLFLVSEPLSSASASPLAICLHEFQYLYTHGI